MNQAELVSLHIIGSGMIKIPKRFLDGNADVTLGASSSFTPLEWFFRRYPDRLIKVAMVIERTKARQFEKPIVSYTREVKQRGPAA